MLSIRGYLAEIGRRGGIKSRRALAPETARRMVAIREARRAARRLDASSATAQRGGTPADTTATAQAVQDALWRRASPAEKLAQVARLSRMVDRLSIEGLKRRHPAASDQAIRDLRAELRLGPDLAARVFAARPNVSNAVHFASAIKVDFFIAGDDPFEAERLRGRERIEMPHAILYVDTAEHTLLRKLEWYRRGGELSERQWRDVQAIARLQGDRLDRDHLHVWAARLGVLDLLERVMRKGEA